MPRLVLVMMAAAAVLCSGASVYPIRLDDPEAVYFHPDGSEDSSEAIQAAIDKVQATVGEGILFIPEGQYRITRTIYVWSGIRIIGYGAHRPVMVLPDNTPGFGQGIGIMFFYTGARPTNVEGYGKESGYHPPRTPPGTVPPNNKIADANPGTFYSAMSNIDFEIGNGNAAAVAVRFHVAQHGYLSHMDFHIGSGLAGLQDIGNEAEDLHFYGGRYGILTRKPSPAWQFTLLDSTFDGQREAGIRENEAGLTLVHDTFKNAPSAIVIDRDYSDQLWVNNSRFENITGPAITISNEHSRLTQINTENLACTEVPVFAKFRESGKTLRAPGNTYRVASFSYGLTLDGLGTTGTMQTKFNAARLQTLPAAEPNAIRPLPSEDTWTNLRSLGAKGDGTTDDTAVIQKAVAEHAVLYVPSGRYLVSDTIKLRPDSVLVGIHPDQTQFDLADGTQGFQGLGTPRPLLEAPGGSTNIISGIGLYTGGTNSRAVGLMWMAGKDSLVDDVRFLGGHGTIGVNGERVNPYNNTHTADPDLRKRWDAQYPSLWVIHGGGGTFANIWTPDTYSQAGFYVEDTSTPGYVYELSSEHHVRNEIVLNHASNWQLYSLQTEGESGESAFGSSLEIEACTNITVANYHGYRVVRSYQPFPYAVRLSHSHDIRFRNVHVDNNSSIGSCNGEGACRQMVRAGKVLFENSIVDETLHQAVRDVEFAFLDVSGDPIHLSPSLPHVALQPNAKVQRLSTGFFNLSGATADAAGDLFFVDPHWQRIYKWAAETEDLTIIRDNSLDPVNLVFDKAGNLIVISSGGAGETVYSFRPGTTEDQITILDPKPAANRPGLQAVLPAEFWVNGDFSNTLSTQTLEYPSLDEMFRKHLAQRKPNQYLSPDGTLFIPAADVYLQGPPYFGTKWADILQAFNLVKATPNHPVFVTNGSDQKTYRGKVNEDGTVSDLQVFAYQGGESLAQDKEGNVFIAAGQIYVYNSAAKLIDIIDVPERPNQLVFGGKDGRTLFILGHSSLFSVRTRFAGLN